MIIIIEGADGVGKTTLANALVAKLNAKYIHLTWSRELNVRMLEYQTECLIEAFEHVMTIGTPCIIDRHWISESIYGQIYRDGPRMPFFGRMVEQFIRSVGGFTIVCLARDLVAHANRFNELKGQRKEMYDNVTKVVQLYNEFYYGGDSDKLHVGYLREMMALGGADKNPQYCKYEMEVEGKYLDIFVEGLRNELNKRIGIRRF